LKKKKLKKKKLKGRIIKKKEGATPSLNSEGAGFTLVFLAG